MKRHPKLIPLSRAHHRQLLLARLMRSDAPAYKGLPDNDEAKLSYAQTIFKSEITSHFEEEELLEKTLLNDNPSPELQNLLKRQAQYRMEVKLGFENLKEASLDQIGRLLEASIRHEERQLYQLIQKEIDLEEFPILFS